MRAYLDHAASTPLLDCARQAMVEALSVGGNPSSLHTAGRAARRRVEESRESIAGALGVTPTEVVFTSGGTEADNLAIKGLWWSRTSQDPGRRRVLASRIEHHAVLDPVQWLADHEGGGITGTPPAAVSFNIGVPLEAVLSNRRYLLTATTAAAIASNSKLTPDAGSAEYSCEA